MLTLMQFAHGLFRSHLILRVWPGELSQSSGRVKSVSTPEGPGQLAQNFQDAACQRRWPVAEEAMTIAECTEVICMCTAVIASLHRTQARTRGALPEGFGEVSMGKITT